MNLLRTIVITIILFQIGTISVTFTNTNENNARKELFKDYDYRFEGGCSLWDERNGRTGIDLTPSDLCYLPTQEARTVEFLRFLKLILSVNSIKNYKDRWKLKQIELIEEISNSKHTDLFFSEVKDKVELFFEKIKNDDDFEAQKLFSSICEKLNTSEFELSYLK